MDNQDASIFIHKVNPKEARIEVVSNASGVRNAQGKWRGGQYCSVVDCHNCTYRDGPRGVKFFRFPTDPTKKERWIKQVNRENPDGSPLLPGANARLCSEHFVSGKSHVPCLFDCRGLEDSACDHKVFTWFSNLEDVE